jgi:DNA modification methylase
MIGDCLKVLRGLPDGMAQTCVTSPPYYGLRDYGHVGQIGLEETPDAYVARLVDVFREVRRVLRDDGTLWLNLGDSYARSEAKGGSGTGGKNCAAYGNVYGLAQSAKVGSSDGAVGRGDRSGSRLAVDGVKYKDLLGIPWMVAFALRADGWFLRSDIIWHKPNPMPESVRDRPTSAHEHVFLLTKRGAYFYDAEAIRQPLADASYVRLAQDVESQAGSARANGGAKTNGPMKAVGGDKQRGHSRRHVGFNDLWDAMSKAEQQAGGANARNVWTIATQPYSGAHFATMPPALAERCIRAGSKPGDMVLDPFGGAGTTGLVADRLGRSATLIELNPEYARLARERITADAPLLMAAQ